ncbi:MAG: Fic family protein [Thermoguttaceae bacterium]|jgi:cell filamentation protein
MVDAPKKRRDRYDVSGNVETQYVDADETVLVNKKGITDLHTLQIAEEEALARAYETLLGEVRIDTPMTCDLLRHIHHRIFGELYDWAGAWRTVWISKPGITWPAPDFLDRNMQGFERNVLDKHPADSLKDDASFCAAVGEIQGEFLVIHPFREGNARTIKVLTNLLAAQTGRPLLVYDSTAKGQERYVDAAKAAFKKQYAPMIALILEALARARQGP